MKQFNAAHLEVKKTFMGGETFETHPYECGWADEAIFFVMVEKNEDELTLRCVPQISPDGVHWVDIAEERIIRGTGLTAIRLSHFGNYLRLRCEVCGASQNEDAEIRLTIQIACKG